MARFRTTSLGNIPFTPEEEARRDAEEAARPARRADQTAADAAQAAARARPAPGVGPPTRAEWEALLDQLAALGVLGR